MAGLSEKVMSYGDAQALKLLAAERLGLRASEADVARNMLAGVPVHITLQARVDREATRLHNLLRKDAARVQEANAHVEALMSEYGFGLVSA